MPKRPPLKVGILISGRGTNMEAVIRACKEKKINAEVVIVISDNPEARGLKIAQEYGVKAIYIPPGNKYKHRLDEEQEREYVRVLKEHGVELVVLAGFMRIVGKILIEAFPNRIINIHPSLLPKYRGLHTHERVLQAGEKVHGASVHFVDEGVDTGKVIMQGKVEVLPDDTPETLAQRVLETVEWKILPKTIGLIADGKISYETLKEPIVYEVGQDIWNSEPLLDPVE